jgi:hypothetical protein
LSLISFKTGTIALVVQDAAEIIESDESSSESLTPKTIFLILSLPGAVNITFDAPPFKCLPRPFSSLQMPVLSITIGFMIP